MPNENAGSTVHIHKILGNLTLIHSPHNSILSQRRSRRKVGCVGENIKITPFAPLTRLRRHHSFLHPTFRILSLRNCPFLPRLPSLRIGRRSLGLWLRRFSVRGGEG